MKLLKLLLKGPILGMALSCVALFAQEQDLANHAHKIFERRCVVCHGCYSSPCNLKLDSFQGLMRGSKNVDIYESRLGYALPPMRMFQDQTSTKAWQSGPYNFKPVVSTQGNFTQNLDQSIMYQMLSFKRSGENLEQKFIYNPEYDRSCPKNESEMQVYKAKNSLYGMPYGLAQLSKEDFKTLEEYIGKGSQEPTELGGGMLNESSPVTLIQIKQWEKQLNLPDLKSQLIGRYLYEHFYSGHIHFTNGAQREFYRLVRSRTQAPLPISEIATVRPYDDPKMSVFYRFKRMVEIPVRKNHTVIEFNDEKFHRFEDLFWNAPFKVSELPIYGKEGANPFIIFKDIPPKSRYQFMLDDAHYFVRTFIRGPVCHGQVATNVIRDNFHIFFIDPKSDLYSNNAEFRKKAMLNLTLPAYGESNPYYAFYKHLQLRYQKLHIKYQPELSLKDLWDGEGTNDQAILTVHRHFNSASVDRGLLGPTPRTSWVLDYPIFERIYYDLVAGFNVYDASFHKIATRRYMDNLRMESEDLLLNFFQSKDAYGIRKYWNQGLGFLKLLKNPFHLNDGKEKAKIPASKNETAISDFIKNVKSRFSEQILKRGQLLNIGNHPLRGIQGNTGAYVRFFPEVSFLRVKNGRGDLAYSIYRNRERIYANYMFMEGHDEIHDTFTVLQGPIANFPNLFLQIEESNLDTFIAEMIAINNIQDYQNFLKKYGVHRTSDNFWETSDFFYDYALKHTPVEAGIFDLTRYTY